MSIITTLGGWLLRGKKNLGTTCPIRKFQGMSIQKEKPIWNSKLYYYIQIHNMSEFGLRMNFAITLYYYSLVNFGRKKYALNR